MILDLDPQSPVPLYQQLVEQVRGMIALGALKAGDRLPTVRDLAVQARINRNTAARTIETTSLTGKEILPSMTPNSRVRIATLAITFPPEVLTSPGSIAVAVAVRWALR